MAFPRTPGGLFPLATRPTGLLPGTMAHAFVINNRALTDAEVRWLGAIAFGG